MVYIPNNRDSLLDIKRVYLLYVMLNGHGTLFHPYVDILFLQKLFETLKQTLYLHIICFLSTYVKCI